MHDKDSSLVPTKGGGCHDRCCTCNDRARECVPKQSHPGVDTPFAVVGLLVWAPAWLVVTVIVVLGGISLIEAITVQVVADSFMQSDSPEAMLARFYMAGVVVAGTLAACRLYVSEDGLLTVFYACFVGVMITDGAAQLTGMFWYRVFGRRTSMAFGLIRPFKITSPK